MGSALVMLFIASCHLAAAEPATTAAKKTGTAQVTKLFGGRLQLTLPKAAQGCPKASEKKLNAVFNSANLCQPEICHPCDARVPQKRGTAQKQQRPRVVGA
jgi:hypothetical protein